MSSPIVLTLPRLVSGRELASTMIEALGDIRDGEVFIDARATTAGTGSFAARLVRDTLVHGQAKRLVLVGAPTEFAQYLTEAADKLTVRDRVEPQGSLPAAAES